MSEILSRKIAEAKGASNARKGSPFHDAFAFMPVRPVAFKVGIAWAVLAHNLWVLARQPWADDQVAEPLAA